MNLRKTYAVDFISDGTDTLTFEIDAPPLGISGTPSQLADVSYSQKTMVPAAPFIKDSSLSGTTVTVTWAAPLPEKDFAQQLAVYTLNFTLTF